MPSPLLPIRIRSSYEELPPVHFQITLMNIWTVQKRNVRAILAGPYPQRNLKLPKVQRGPRCFSDSSKNTKARNICWQRRSSKIQKQSGMLNCRSLNIWTREKKRKLKREMSDLDKKKLEMKSRDREKRPEADQKDSDLMREVLMSFIMKK